MKRFNKNRRDVEKSVNRYGGQPFKYSKNLHHAFVSKNYMRVSEFLSNYHQVGQILLSANGNNKKETVEIIISFGYCLFSLNFNALYIFL